VTASYKLVQWNRHKRIYDAVIALACAGYLASFVAFGMMTHEPPNSIDVPILAMRALGTLAIVLVHLILLIGPMARLTTLAAPLLYNRRHLGVTFFLIALLHGLIATGYYGGFGVHNPASSVLASYADFRSVSGFPFEVLGFLALLIFFVMAATSHDFWLAALGPRFWKSLHMLVYAAYVLVMAHVALGPLQSEPNALYIVLLSAGGAAVVSAHVVAAVKERRVDRAPAPDADADGWIHAADIEDLDDNAAMVVCVRDAERIALVRHGDKVSAVSNVCAHQGGPLGEGRVIDGCLTCPWHGYQYRPAEGQSPPPYSETIPTYEVRLDGSRIMVNPRPNAPGTPVEPVRVAADRREGGTSS